MATTHRIWDFRGDQAAVIWFRKHPDGSVRILQTYVNSGFALAHYAEIAAVEPKSVDYVRPDVERVRDLRGETLFEAMRRFGLNPEVLPAAAWRSPAPFAVAP